MKSVVSLVFFFLVVFPLYASQKGMHIIVSTYSSDKGADEELQRLQKAMMGHKEILRLQKSDGFRYVLRPVGEYTRVVIEPFEDGKTFRTVLKTVVKYYPDAYIGGHRPVRSVTSDATSTKKSDNAVSREELRVRVDEFLEETMPLVPYVPESVTKKGIEQVGATSVQMLKNAIDDTKMSAKSTPMRRSDPGTMLMVLVAIFLTMTFAFILWRRSKKKKRKVLLQDFSDRQIPDIPQYTKP